MNRRRASHVWIVSSLLVAAAGCSSTHNLKTGGVNPFGGGFADEEIRPGLYRLNAIGNMAPWPSFSAAIETWRGRAEQLCGKGAYEEVVEARSAGYQGSTPTYAGGTMLVNMPKYNPSLSGYVLCKDAGMTRSEAIKYLDDLREARAKQWLAAQTAELEALGGPDCTTGKAGASPGDFLHRGKLLSAIGNYQSAMRCLLRAQEAEQDTPVYRESCSAIAMMYELGWGVEKDISKAMSWYRKAGI